MPVVVFDDWRHDLKYACRGLLQQPGFTVLAMVAGSPSSSPRVVRHGSLRSRLCAPSEELRRGDPDVQECVSDPEAAG